MPYSTRPPRSGRRRLGETTILLLVLALLLDGATAQTSAVAETPRLDFYAAPDGSPAGDGTKTRPWGLGEALARSAAVPPGATLWLRGGIYRGSFESALAGGPDRPVTIREMPGERAILDAAGPTNGGLVIRGGWARFWGFEVRNSYQDRISEEQGSRPGSYDRGAGITVLAPHIDLINLVVYDNGTGVGFWSPAVDSTASGLIVFNNGWASSDRGHGHGLYVQSDIGSKLVEDVISFNNFATGMKGYGHNGRVRNISFERVISFNNGSPDRLSGGRQPNILVGTDEHPAENVEIESSFLYHRPETTAPNLQLGYVADNESIAVRDNWVAGGRPLHMMHWRSAVVEENGFVTADTNEERRPMVHVETDRSSDYTDFSWRGNDYFDLTTDWPHSSISRPFHVNDIRAPDGRGRIDFDSWKNATGWDADSTYQRSLPERNVVKILPNRYEKGRAHVVVYNWEQLAHVDLDLDGILEDGQRFEVLNAQDLFGTPVAEGVYRQDGAGMTLNALKRARNRCKKRKHVHERRHKKRKHVHKHRKHRCRKKRRRRRRWQPIRTPVPTPVPTPGEGNVPPTDPAPGPVAPVTRAGTTTVRIPLDDLRVTPPIGLESAPASSAPYFSVFVIRAIDDGVSL